MTPFERDWNAEDTVLPPELLGGGLRLQPAKKPAPRRLKILLVSSEVVLELLQAASKHPPRIIDLPVLDELPEGVRVHRVYWDDTRAGFGFVVEHESFPDVDVCEEIPVIGGLFGLERQSFRLRPLIAEP